MEYHQPGGSADYFGSGTGVYRQHKILWEEAINDAVEEAKNEMGVEFVEDVDKDAFREATKG